MNFDQLKTFYKVALNGSFTKAARLLHLTQPAVSQQIQALEHSLGITLFDRSGKKVRLTNEGDILLSYTDRLFNLYDEVQTLFELQQRLQKGKITIGSTSVLGTYFLPQIIGQYTRQYPGIEIDLRMGNSRHIIDITLEGEVDLGFAGKIGTHSRLGTILIHRDPLIIVSSPDHYLAAKKTVSMDELLKSPFIWREKGTQTRKIVKKWFKESLGKNFPPQTIELESVEAAKRIVEEGYGITIIPEMAVRREITAGQLKRINIEGGLDLTIDFNLFYLNSKVFSKAAKTYLKIIYSNRILSYSKNLIDILEG